MLGCALLKVQLRELLTCLELEIAWSLVEWHPEVEARCVSCARHPPLDGLAASRRAARTRTLSLRFLRSSSPPPSDGISPLK
ncbi:coiled-coil-helix-coiled-coil-helix domain-containing protein 7 isoform X3 [Phyllostomus discolor]|uniref:Coiled-coil-helix-coiled-coil-helix domain-containing protein 7 isoform X3 n=1 Tax=Phyllostomus discolor TaxID=89673 RepID=A0A7E6E6W6_9CHIR|nr:coiled-coil-helix-coiled-coil-helix domain-containing protein 7 isoform X3 [Phyllostomus discolor]